MLPGNANCLRFCEGSAGVAEEEEEEVLVVVDDDDDDDDDEDDDDDDDISLAFDVLRGFAQSDTP